jgi:hypothetical protein
MLEDLQPAKKIEAPSGFRPAVEFDGNEGVVTTEGLQSQPDFSEFLEARGYSSDEYEIVGSPRTSQWQRWDGEWLTSYRFHFRKKVTSVDLPTLFAEAKKTKAPKPAKTSNGKAFVIAPADYQVGKTDVRGGTKELVERVMQSYDCIEEHLKANKYEKIVIVDVGDIIESVSNTADQAQLQSNDLSPMQQVDMAASLMWDLLKRATKYAPVMYGSVASNHCQWRHNKQPVGKPGRDDWGIVILQQLRRLATEVGLNVQFFVPHPEDEGFAIDVFDDGMHILGCIHGHQARRPDQVPTHWRQSTFGSQFLAPATLLLTGHFHHTRVQELGAAPSGGSRWWVQASTMDAGSSWFRRMSGEDSMPAITCIELERGVYYQGEIKRF